MLMIHSPDPVLNLIICLYLVVKSWFLKLSLFWHPLVHHIKLCLPLKKTFFYLFKYSLPHPSFPGAWSAQLGSTIEQLPYKGLYFWACNWNQSGVLFLARSVKVWNEKRSARRGKWTEQSAVASQRLPRTLHIRSLMLTRPCFFSHLMLFPG